MRYEKYRTMMDGNPTTSRAAIVSPEGASFLQPPPPPPPPHDSSSSPSCSVSSSSSSSSSASLHRRQQQHQQYPSQQPRYGSKQGQHQHQQSNNTTHNQNHAHTHTRNRNSNKRLPMTKPALSPAPFLSFHVQDKTRAVYVGNIPFHDEGDTPCCHCYNSNNNNNSKNTGSRKQGDDDNGSAAKTAVAVGTNSENPAIIIYDKNDNKMKIIINGCCRYQTLLKKFLLGRINAAFKVPMKEIQIQTVRFFSVVTNMYDVVENSSSSSSNGSKNNTNSKDRHITTDCCDGDSSVVVDVAQHQKLRLRRHLAACVEFEDGKHAEYALALKNTIFQYDTPTNNRSYCNSQPLRMRRWTMERPHTKTKRVQQQQSPLPAVPKGRGQNDDDDESNGNAVTPIPATITNNANVKVRTESISSSSSAMVSSAAVYVRNLPPGVTEDDIRFFFLRRMNKAFQGVSAPDIQRIGIRRRPCRHHHQRLSTNGNNNNNNNNNNNKIETDAYVEFQDPKVAYRALLLKNRRWYVELHRETNNSNKDSNNDENKSNNNSGGGSSSNINSNNDNNKEDLTVPSSKSSWWKMPTLEVKAWDPEKLEIKSFFPVMDDTTNDIHQEKKDPVEGENRDEESIPLVLRNDQKDNSVVGINTENNSDEKKLDRNRYDDHDDSSCQNISNEDRNNNDLTAKNYETPRNQWTITRKDAAMKGFLVCKNYFNVPKLDHLFTTKDQDRKNRLCFGCCFLGQLCCNQQISYRNGVTKESNYCKSNYDRCCFDSFEDIADPYDQMAVLYYVNNNDDVAFVPREGYTTPQEYYSSRRKIVEEILTMEQEAQQLSNYGEHNDTTPTVTSNNGMLIDNGNLHDNRRNDHTIIIHDLETKLEDAREKLRERELSSQNQLNENATLRNQLQQLETQQNEKNISNRSLQSKLSETESELSEANQKLNEVELVVMEIKQKYSSPLNEDFQQQNEQRRFMKITEYPEIHDEISQLKNDPKIQNQLQQQLPQTNIEQVLVKYDTHAQTESIDAAASANTDNFQQLNHSWPQCKQSTFQFEKFLQTSVPELMKMAFTERTNGESNITGDLFSPTKSRLDIIPTATTTATSPIPIPTTSDQYPLLPTSINAFSVAELQQHANLLRPKPSP